MFFDKVGIFLLGVIEKFDIKLSILISIRKFFSILGMLYVILLVKMIWDESDVVLVIFVVLCIIIIIIIWKVVSFFVYFDI